MKISFDFEGVLEKPTIQRLAKKFIDDGHEVWITTARVDSRYGPENWNDDIKEVAAKLHIPSENIILTNGTDKWCFLGEFDMHFDDDPEEISGINTYLESCVGILISKVQ